MKKDALSLPALPMVPQKLLSRKRSAKTSQLLAKRSNFTALLPINVRCHWNAAIIANVFLAASAQQIARSMNPSAAPGATVPPEPVTDVPTGADASSTSISTALKMPGRITVPYWSTPDRESILLSGKLRQWLKSSDRSFNRDSPPTRSSLAIRSSASPRKRSTITSKETCSKRSRALPLWTFAVRYPGRSWVQGSSNQPSACGTVLP